MNFWNSWTELRVKMMDEKELNSVIDALYENAMRMASCLDEDVQAVLLEDAGEEEELIW